MVMVRVVCDLENMCMVKCISDERIVLPTVFATKHVLGKKILALRNERKEYLISNPQPVQTTNSVLFNPYTVTPLEPNVDLRVILSTHATALQANGTYMYVATNKNWNLLSDALDAMLVNPSYNKEWLRNAIRGCVQTNDSMGLQLCYAYLCSLPRGRDIFLHMVMLYNQDIH